eukprot:COSAG02_NODE_22036_length_765_cov_84.209491_2_plen_64_part_01
MSENRPGFCVYDQNCRYSEWLFARMTGGFEVEFTCLGEKAHGAAVAKEGAGAVADRGGAAVVVD